MSYILTIKVKVNFPDWKIQLDKFGILPDDSKTLDKEIQLISKL